MQISMKFAWYDLWVGAYWKASSRCLYVCPLPMFCILLDFGAPPVVLPLKVHAPAAVPAPQPHHAPHNGDAAQRAAELFLVSIGVDEPAHHQRLAALLMDYAVAGYRVAIDRAKAMYRTLGRGDCRQLSQGDECDCLLCQLDDARKSTS